MNRIRAFALGAGLVGAICGGQWVLAADSSGLGESWLGASGLGASLGAPQTSASALYNSGNDYARHGKTALAILAYERAQVLAPNDSDIMTNLRHERTVAGLAPDGRSWFERQARMLSPNVMYWLGVLGLAIACSSVLGARMMGGRRSVGKWFGLGDWRGLGEARRVSGVKRRSLRLAAVFGGGMALGCGMAVAAVCDGLATWPLMHAAVVMHPTAARIAPVADGDRAFPLLEGQTVETASALNGYVFVTDDARQSGWVPVSELKSIAPRG